MNIGKAFERDFKASIPDGVWVYRPPDAAQSFHMDKNLRFSAHSPCDFMLYDGNVLLFLELKTFSGACSFERTKGEHGIIHYYQSETLRQYAGYRNTVAGFLLDFRKIGSTYFLNIGGFDRMVDNISKKSFNERDMLTYGNPIELSKRKLRVNYRYDILKLLSDIRKEDKL